MPDTSIWHMLAPTIGLKKSLVEPISSIKKVASAGTFRHSTAQYALSARDVPAMVAKIVMAVLGGGGWSAPYAIVNAIPQMSQNSQ